MASDMKAWVLTYSRVETNSQKQTGALIIGEKTYIHYSNRALQPNTRFQRSSVAVPFWFLDSGKNKAPLPKPEKNSTVTVVLNSGRIFWGTNQNHLRSQLCKHDPSEPIETWLWNHAEIHGCSETSKNKQEKKTSETNIIENLFIFSWQASCVQCNIELESDRSRNQWNNAQLSHPDPKANETVHDSRIACSRQASNFTPQTGKFGTRPTTPRMIPSWLQKAFRFLEVTSSAWSNRSVTWKFNPFLVPISVFRNGKLTLPCLHTTIYPLKTQRTTVTDPTALLSMSCTLASNCTEKHRKTWMYISENNVKKNNRCPDWWKEKLGGIARYGIFCTTNSY